MRLSIRLQNHGKKNHPYWRIVVAPQKKNIFGCYTDHIGYWSPRHNVNIKRQVAFNLPRLMYWISNGAIPTYKIHKFLHMFGIFPKPWKYVKSAVQLAEQAKKQKPYEQMTPKQKSLFDRRKKRQEREQLSKHQYHRYEAYSMREDKTMQQIIGKRQDNQFQNKVLRDMLHQADFQKYDRLAQLSGNSFSSKPTLQRLNEVKQKLRKSRSELAFLDKQYTNSRMLQKSKLIEKINQLIKNMNQIEIERVTINYPQDPVNSEEYITEDYLAKKLKYELITKRFQKTKQELEIIQKLFQPITVKQYANRLQQLKKTKPEAFDYYQDPYLIAQNVFQEVGSSGGALTRLDLLGLDPEYQQYIYEVNEQDEQINPMAGNHKSVIQMILKNEVSLPSLHPVHPRPDLKTYIPQQHYDPIDVTKLDIMMMDSLEPHQELQKYMRKRNPSESIEQRKKRDSNKRMQRLRLLTQV